MSSEATATVERRATRPSPGGTPAIRALGVGKRYRLGRTRGIHRYRSLREELAGGVRRGTQEAGDQRSIWAVRDVTFDVAEGEVVGIIGRNGAGKSTLLKMLSAITPPTEGRAELAGRVGSLLEVGSGFHPELTGRENVLLAGAVLGMRKAEIVRKLDEIVAFAGVEAFIDTPVKRYSSGMYLRLAFAVAAHLEPEILLVDEVLAVGDAEFQRKCLGRMADIGSSGRTVLFVSHSMPAVLRLCPRVLLLERGRLVADGPAHEVVRSYLDSGSGTAAAHEWQLSEAPGDDIVRLQAVRVRNDRGEIADQVDITRPFTVEVEYWQLREEPLLRPSANLHFFNEEGVCLFVSADLVNRGWAATARRSGAVRAVCHVPGNFLAEGRVFVTAAVSSINPVQVHAIEHNTVAFEVLDRSLGEGARGDFGNHWPGAVRPLLEWTAEPTWAGVDGVDIEDR